MPARKPWISCIFFIRSFSALMHRYLTFIVGLKPVLWPVIVGMLVALTELQIRKSVMPKIGQIFGNLGGFHLWSLTTACLYDFLYQGFNCSVDSTPLKDH